MTFARHKVQLGGRVGNLSGRKSVNAAAGGTHFAGEKRHPGVRASAGGSGRQGRGPAQSSHWLVAQTLGGRRRRGRQGCWRKEGEGRAACSSHENGDCCENGRLTPLPTPPGPPGPTARPSVFSEPLTAPELALSGPFPTAQGLSPSEPVTLPLRTHHPSSLSPSRCLSALGTLSSSGLRSPVYLPAQTLGLRPVKAPPSTYSSPAPSGHAPAI